MTEDAVGGEAGRGSEHEAAIWISERRMGGMPCLHGTRLPMRQLHEMEAAHGIEEIMHGWPYLDRDHVEHALRLYREMGCPRNPEAFFGRSANTDVSGQSNADATDHRP
jgi:uncharacterized protein (DUF433 family)